MISSFRILVIIVILTTVSACVTLPPAHDYSAFRAADPHSILILTPINDTPEVIAPYSVMTQMAMPIAESGYYVFPVALVDQTFKNNGLTVANDVQAVPVETLYKIFGADAALYLTIENYGTSYVVLSSETLVTVSAQLIDLRTGQLLWQDNASASSAEQRGSNNSGLIGLLVEAAITQIIETVADKGFEIAAITSNRLLSSESHNGLLHGPRSMKYGRPATSESK